MQARDAYPPDALTGSCFVTGDYDPANGIVDLELYTDALPPFGRLCLSGKAVRDMVTCLGLEWPDRDVVEQLDTALQRLDTVMAENFRLRKAVANILRATELAKLDSWVES